MIVRISGEDQYRLPDEAAEHLNELESKVIAVVDSGGADGFRDAFGALLQYVRDKGTPVGEQELAASDVILPPADISLEEARADFSGEGLIPD